MDMLTITVLQKIPEDGYKILFIPDTLEPTEVHLHIASCSPRMNTGVVLVYWKM